jgi:hypothetical protein
MKSKKVFVALLLVLSFTALSFKCDSGGGSGSLPPDSPWRGAAKAADDIAAGIQAMIKIKRALAANGTLKPAEERPLTTALLKLNTADKAFVREIRAIKSVSDASTNKPKLCTALAALNAALSEVNSNVTPVGDPNAKGQLATAFTTITNLMPAITNVLSCP